MQSLQQFLTAGLGGLVFLLVITVLVAVHELGHLWIARLCGMKVDAFAIMMGGRRVTDLSPHLKAPLAPSRLVWVASTVGVVILLLGISPRLAVLYPLGLLAVGLAVPVWIGTRIAALYHLDGGQVSKPFGICWLIGIAVLFPAFRAGSVTPAHMLAMLSYASWVAVIVLYYQPMLRKGEDGPMGEGVIPIEGTDVPVRFRPLWARTAKSGTEYSLLVLPLGGFAAIKGMAPKADGSETRIEDGFYGKGPLKRLASLLAGPAFSVIFGVMILTGLFTTVGESKPDLAPIIGQVSDDGVAAKAGLKEGDRIVSVNGRQVSTFYDALVIIRDRPLMATSFEYVRNGHATRIVLKPDRTKEPAPVLDANLEPTDETRIMGKLGIGPKTKMVRLSFPDAVQQAWSAPVQMVSGLLAVARQPSKAKDQVGGPGTIAVAAVEATSQGFATVLLLAGVLSVSLGVMNLLPIWPLDGGQIIVAIIELFRGGKRLSMQVQQLISSGGMLMVMLLVVCVVALDANRFLGPKEKLTTDQPLPQSQSK